MKINKNNYLPVVICLSTILFLTFLGFNAIRTFSEVTGRVGRTLPSSEGCGGTNCHGPAVPSTSTIIDVSSGTGYFTVTPGTTLNFTVTVRNDMSLGAGINIAVKDINGENAGTLAKVQNDLRVLNGELTQSISKLLENGRTTFDFTWTAPAQQGTYTMFVAACGVNNDGLASALDYWAWMYPQELKVYAGPPILSCNPAGIDFKEVKYTRHVDTTIKVRNAGRNQLSVTGIELTGPNASEFSLPGSTSTFTLEPDSSRIIKIRFTPADMSGNKTATIVFTNNGTENPVNVPLYGVCKSQPMPVITLSTELLDFGDVKATEFKELELTVKNTGDFDLTVNSTNLSGPNAKEFSFASATNFLLKPDSSIIILVRFNPLTAGNKSAQFNFSSTSKSDPIVYLVGKALPGPKPTMLFSVNPLVFEKTAVGTHLDKTTIIKNNGEIPLEVTAIKITGVNASEFSIASGGGNFSLNANEQRNLTVRFTPIIEGIGKTADIEFTSNDDVNPKLNLQADAYILPSPTIVSSINELDFGKINATQSKDTSFKISNKGNIDLIIQQPVLSGNDSLEFYVLTQIFPRTVKPDEALNLMVRFQPKTAGDKRTNLVINSNDKTLTIPLFGSAKPFSSVAELTGSCTFINAAPNPFSEIITFRIDNDNLYNLKIYDVSGKPLMEKNSISGAYIWDIRGMQIVNGIYYAVFEQSGKFDIMKINVVR